MKGKKHKPEQVILRHERFQINDRPGLGLNDMRSLHERPHRGKQGHSEAKRTRPNRWTDQEESDPERANRDRLFQHARSFVDVSHRSQVFGTILTNSERGNCFGRDLLSHLRCAGQRRLSHLGFNRGDILKSHGIEPVPDRQRQTTWSTFLKSHWDVLAAIDFTTIEVWTKRGRVTYYLLFVIELKTRRVCFAGCTPNPHERWMKQMARNLTEALSRMIFFGEKSLRRAVTAFLAHYHAERNHQGLANELIQPGDEVGMTADKIECRERPGGLLKYDHLDAA